MNIILFSLPLFGKAVIQKLVDQGNPPTFVVAPARSHVLFDKTVRMAHDFNLPVIMFDNHPTDEKFVERINGLAPDLIISASYPHLIPSSVYSAAKIAAINAHPSLLPNYRGANPFYHVVANNEQEAGVTLHLLDNSFDTGNILNQTRIKLGNRETTGSLENKLSHVAADTIVDFVNTAKTAGLPKTIKQNNSIHHKKAPQISLPFDPINWNMASLQIDCHIRAANPYGINSLLKEEYIGIISGKPIKSISTHKIPGQIEFINETGMAVTTGEGAYLITCLDYLHHWTGDPLGLFDLGLIKSGDCFKGSSIY